MKPLLRRAFYSALAGIVLSMTILASTSSALAWQPFDKARRLLAQTQPSTKAVPPAADHMARECDPIRQKVVALNQHKGLVHFFFRPRISFLKGKYKRCGDRFREKEYEYLKRATIEIPDPLPPMNAEQALIKEKAR